MFVCVVLHSKSMLPGPMLTSLGWRPRGGVGGWGIGRGGGSEELGVAPARTTRGALVAGGGAAANIFVQLGERLIYSICSVIEGTI